MCTGMLMVFIMLFFSSSAVISSEQGCSNIILITISSLRYDHVGFMGYHRDTTDNFDNFAKDSAVFTDAYSTSGWMMPSTGSLFTSLLPSEHKATDINRKLDPNCQTLAELLSRAGYRTAGFCCNPRLSGDYGFGKGFELYDDFTVSVMLESMTFGHGRADINQSRTNNIINESAMRWLEMNRRHRFFLFVHYYDNHWDYLPQEPYRSMYDPNYTGPIDGKKIAREPLYSNMPDDADVEHMIALYDGQVKQTDDDLGKFLRYLKDKNCYKSSLIIIASDHGEAFYEYGHTSHHGIYQQLTHIPLALHLPEGFNRRHIVFHHLVSILDIAPTILDYANVKIPKSFIGKSLRPLLAGHSEKLHEYLPMEYSGGAVQKSIGARTARYKFVKTSHSIFCYDLVKDPGQISPIDISCFDDNMLKRYHSIDFLKRPLPVSVDRQ